MTSFSQTLLLKTDSFYLNMLSIVTFPYILIAYMEIISSVVNKAFELHLINRRITHTVTRLSVTRENDKI